jgi:hypothetical protein
MPAVDIYGMSKSGSDLRRQKTYLSRLWFRDAASRTLEIPLSGNLSLICQYFSTTLSNAMMDPQKYTMAKQMAYRDVK